MELCAAAKSNEQDLEEVLREKGRQGNCFLVCDLLPKKGSTNAYEFFFQRQENI